MTMQHNTYGHGQSSLAAQPPRYTLIARQRIRFLPLQAGTNGGTQPPIEFQPGMVIPAWLAGAMYDDGTGQYGISSNAIVQKYLPMYGTWETIKPTLANSWLSAYAAETIAVDDRRRPCRAGEAHDATGRCIKLSGLTPGWSYQYGPGLNAQPDQLAAPQQGLFAVARDRLRFITVGGQEFGYVIEAGLPIPSALLYISARRDGGYQLTSNAIIDRYVPSNGTWERVKKSYPDPALPPYAAKLIAIVDKGRPCRSRGDAHLVDGSCARLPSPPPGTTILEWMPTSGGGSTAAAPDALARRPGDSAQSTPNATGATRRIGTSPNWRLVRLTARRVPYYLVRRGDNTTADILRAFGQPPEQAFNLMRLNPHKRVMRFRGVPRFERLIPGERLIIPSSWLASNGRRGGRVGELLGKLAAKDFELVRDGLAVRLWNLGAGPDHWRYRTPQLGRVIQTMGVWPCDDGYTPTYDGDCVPVQNGGTGEDWFGGDDPPPDVPVDNPPALNAGQPCEDPTTGEKGYIDLDGFCITQPITNECPPGTTWANASPGNPCVKIGGPCDINGDPEGGVYDENGYCFAKGGTPVDGGGGEQCGGNGCNTATTTWTGTRCELNAYGQSRENMAEAAGQGWEYQPCDDTFYNTTTNQSGLSVIPGSLPPDCSQYPGTFPFQGGCAECAPNSVWNPQAEQCYCIPGHHWNADSSGCVPDPPVQPGETPCGANQYRAQPGGPCIDKPAPVPPAPVGCPTGQHKDDKGLCVPDVPVQPVDKPAVVKEKKKGLSGGAIAGIAALVIGGLALGAKAMEGGGKGKGNARSKPKSKKAPSRALARR